MAQLQLAITAAKAGKAQQDMNKAIQERGKSQKQLNKYLKDALNLQLQLNKTFKKKGGDPDKLDDLKTIKDLTIKILDAQISYAKTIQDTDKQLSNMVLKQIKHGDLAQQAIKRQEDLKQAIIDYTKELQKGNLSSQKRRQIQNQIVEFNNQIQQAMVQQNKELQNQYKTYKEIQNITSQI